MKIYVLKYMHSDTFMYRNDFLHLIMLVRLEILTANAPFHPDISLRISQGQESRHITHRFNKFISRIYKVYISCIYIPITTKPCLKAIAHYTLHCKKCSYLPYTLQLVVTTATIFSTVVYMGNDFLDKCLQFFCVVC